MKPWCSSILAIGLLVLASAGPAAAPRPSSEDVQVVTLANGLRVLMAPDPRGPAVDVAVWYEVGPRYERAGITGISHLFEHMMFGGSAKFGPREHTRRIEAEGGTAGAFTTADFMCFYESLPPEALELAFELEADRMGSLNLTQALLDTQRRLVRDERRLTVGTNPLVRGLERAYAMAFTRHPYRWPVFGLERDLNRLTLADCQAFYRTQLVPGRAVLSIVGNFDPTQALELARKHFEPIKKSTAGATMAAVEDPPQASERRAVEAMPLQFPMLIVAWRGPGIADSSAPALDLIAAILGVGETSRLQAKLVNPELLGLYVQTGVESRRDASLLYAAVSLVPPVDTLRVERELFSEIERLAAEPVSGEELDKAKRQFEISMLFGLETARGRAQALGTAQMLAGDSRDAMRRLERIRALTPTDLQRAAAEHLSASERTLVWIRPGPAPPAARTLRRAGGRR